MTPPKSNPLPAALGYRMPAEWEPHAATWIAWPHNPKDWPGRFAPIPWVYAEIVRHLSAGERVEVLVQDASAREKARKILTTAGVDLAQVRFHVKATDRVWIRDSGATFLVDKAGALAACEWRFNAWAKYPDWKRDVKVASYMASAAKARIWQPCAEAESKGGGMKATRAVLEGGSIDVNGRGTVLATEECLLSHVQQRNPGFTREEYQCILADYLGADNVIWLKRGIVGDDTHGHVDDIARFVSPRKVVLAVEEDPADENHAVLAENYDILRAARDQDGRPLTVIPLPLPKPVIFCKQRLPASYANFYISNQRVLVPTFNDPNDRVALNTLADLFPDREVVGIYCGDFIWGLGAVHCMTQQQPA